MKSNAKKPMNANMWGKPVLSSRTNTERGRVRWPLLVLAVLLLGSGALIAYQFKDVLGRQPWAVKGLVWLGIKRSDSGPPQEKGTAPASAEAHPAAPAGEGAAKPPAGKVLYHCPMHPSYISDHPGDCPICGMKLVPIEKTEEMKGKGLPGHAPVRIAPEMQQLIGVKMARVERRRISKTIRAVSIIGYDETKLATYTMRYGGWLDKLFVNYTGQLVKKGEPLATVYGPDLLLAQYEYLIALDAVEHRKPGGRPEGWRSDQDLVTAAREKLKLFDLTDEQIAELAKTRKPQTYLPLHSPITGYVTKRNVVKRSYMAMGQDLYEIADLSMVWVNVDVYEYEMSLVKVGQEAAFEPTSEPGRLYKGKVAFIFPTLNNDTRTVTVRLEFPNPEMKLKPQMYGNVTIRADLGDQLAVDDSAVMFTGAEEIVFVSLGDGYFEPRQVTVGPRAEGKYVIQSGLKEGESVVAAANFLVDSESRLKAAMMSMGAPTEAGIPSPESGKGKGAVKEMPPMPGMQH